MKRLAGCVRLVAALFLGSVLAGCLGGGGGGGGLNLSDIGDNNAGVVLVMGDSITSGRGIPAGPPYPARLAAAIGKTVVNAGASATTTGDGARRIGALLKRHKPGVVIILYGANDAIRGIGVQTAANNISSMVAAARNNQSKVIVCTILPMSGSRRIFNGRVDAINAAFPPLVKGQGAVIVNLNREFKGREDSLLLDGLHPNSAGNDVIAASLADRF